MSLLRLYHAFGHFLSDVYTIPSGYKNAGQQLMPEPMLINLRTFMHQVYKYLQESFKCDAKHHLFFTCLSENAKTDSRKWFQKLTHNLVYASFKHHAETGACVCVLLLLS